MDKISVIAILAFIAIGMAATATVTAVDLDSNMIMSGRDVSLVKGYTNYNGVTNTTISQYEQYVYGVNLAAFDYNSTAWITDSHEVAIETELTAIRAPYTGIGGADYIDNAGVGDNESCCVFGIAGSGHNLVVASIVGILPTTLTQTYVVDATRGEASVGYAKATENVSTHGRYTVRGEEAFVAGQRTCTKYPEAFVGEEDGHNLCVWQGDGGGYPIFSAVRGNETAPTYKYYVRRGTNAE